MDMFMYIAYIINIKSISVLYIIVLFFYYVFLEVFLSTCLYCVCIFHYYIYWFAINYIR